MAQIRLLGPLAAFALLTAPALASNHPIQRPLQRDASIAFALAVRASHMAGFLNSRETAGLFERAGDFRDDLRCRRRDAKS